MERETTMIGEIALDSLSAADRLLIRTRNSTYRFVVTDPAAFRGTLVREAMRACEGDSVLIGARARNGHLESDTLKLKTGSRAIFLIESGGCLKRIITSAITQLVHARSQNAQRHTRLTPDELSGDAR